MLKKKKKKKEEETINISETIKLMFYLISEIENANKAQIDCLNNQINELNDRLDLLEFETPMLLADVYNEVTKWEDRACKCIKKESKSKKTRKTKTKKNKKRGGKKCQEK